MEAADKKDSRFSIGVILLLLVIAGLAIFIGWGILKAAFPPKPPLQGQMEARTLSVASKSPGRIEEILVEEGQMVKKGQPVVKMSLPVLDAKLSMAQAQEKAAVEKSSIADDGARPEQRKAVKARWEALQAEAELAEKTWRRLDALYKDGLVSAERHDQAYATWQAAAQDANAAREEYELIMAGSRQQEKDAARDMVAEAHAGVEEVQSLVDDTVLLAPRAAQVDRVLLVGGELTSAGFPVVTLVDIADQWATFNILEKDMPGISLGKELIADIPAIAQKNLPFQIYYISPRASFATWRSTREDTGYDMKTFEVRARPKTVLPDLRPGMSVLVNRK